MISHFLLSILLSILLHLRINTRQTCHRMPTETGRGTQDHATFVAHGKQLVLLIRSHPAQRANRREKSVRSPNARRKEDDLM